MTDAAGAGRRLPIGCCQRDSGLESSRQTRRHDQAMRHLYVELKARCDDPTWMLDRP